MMLSQRFWISFCIMLLFVVVARAIDININTNINHRHRDTNSVRLQHTVIHELTHTDLARGRVDETHKHKAHTTAVMQEEYKCCGCGPDKKAKKTTCWAGAIKMNGHVGFFRVKGSQSCSAVCKEFGLVKIEKKDGVCVRDTTHPLCAYETHASCTAVLEAVDGHGLTKVVQKFLSSDSGKVCKTSTKTKKGEGGSTDILCQAGGEPEFERVADLVLTQAFANFEFSDEWIKCLKLFADQSKFYCYKNEQPNTHAKAMKEAASALSPPSTLSDLEIMGIYRYTAAWFDFYNPLMRGKDAIDGVTALNPSRTVAKLWRTDWDLCAFEADHTQANAIYANFVLDALLVSSALTKMRKIKAEYGEQPGNKKPYPAVSGGKLVKALERGDNGFLHGWFLAALEQKKNVAIPNFLSTAEPGGGFGGTLEWQINDEKIDNAASVKFLSKHYGEMEYTFPPYSLFKVESCDKVVRGKVKLKSVSWTQGALDAAIIAGVTELPPRQ